MSAWTIATLCLPVVSLVFGLYAGHLMKTKNCYFAGKLALLVALVLTVLFNPYFSVFHYSAPVADSLMAAKALFYQMLVFALSAGFLFGGWLSTQFGNLGRLT